MALEGKQLPVASGKSPLAPMEERVGFAAGPAQQGQSPDLPPISEETEAAASSSSAGAAKWPNDPLEELKLCLPKRQILLP